MMIGLDDVEQLADRILTAGKLTPPKLRDMRTALGTKIAGWAVDVHDYTSRAHGERSLSLQAKGQIAAIMAKVERAFLIEPCFDAMQERAPFIDSELDLAGGRAPGRCARIAPVSPSPATPIIVPAQPDPRVQELEARVESLVAQLEHVVESGFMQHARAEKLHDQLTDEIANGLGGYAELTRLREEKAGLERKTECAETVASDLADELTRRRGELEALRDFAAAEKSHRMGLESRIADFSQVLQDAGQLILDFHVRAIEAGLDWKDEHRRSYAIRERIDELTGHYVPEPEEPQVTTLGQFLNEVSIGFERAMTEPPVIVTPEEQAVWNSDRYRKGEPRYYVSDGGQFLAQSHAAAMEDFEYRQRAKAAGATIDGTTDEIMFDDPAKGEAFIVAERQRVLNEKTIRLGGAYKMGLATLKEACEAIRAALPIVELDDITCEGCTLTQEAHDRTLADLAEVRSNAAHQTSANLELHRKLDERERVVKGFGQLVANQAETISILRAEKDELRSQVERANERLAGRTADLDTARRRAERLDDARRRLAIREQDRRAEITTLENERERLKRERDGWKIRAEALEVEIEQASR